MSFVPQFKKKIENTKNISFHFAAHQVNNNFFTILHSLVQLIRFFEIPYFSGKLVCAGRGTKS